MIDFSVPPEIAEVRKAVSDFMDRHVYPAERQMSDEGEGLPLEVLRGLQAKAKAQGLWAPHMPEEVGGMGIGVVALALLNEVIGRSPIGPIVLGCQAPDAGNCEILHLYGTEAQKQRWLLPNVAGEIRSCFSMTEPEVSGSDPTGLRTTAVLDGDHWVINGHKWFTSGALGAAFAIVMAKTDPQAKPHSRFSQIIVPTDTPGFQIVRPVPVMGHTRARGGHCEIRYEDCRVPAANLLGPRGEGFRIAQARLGPGRIQHCMRWLGVAQRSFELMCRYVTQRETFGGKLAEKQTIQNWIADSAAEIQAARLMTLHAAWKMDQKLDARVDISLIKFFGAKVLIDVIDRAIQAHGAAGISADLPLESFYREARAARIYDGPDEVHRMVVARRILREFQQ
jgi:alkylation response protein AidB-like acyl-CoA dehydrogenase